MQDKVVYLTHEGKQRFAAELHELQTVKRHQVEDQIRRAKEFADTVDNAEGDEETYYLVGSHEADPRRGLISNESPIGRALIGKRVGDEVTVVAPAGSFNLKILDI